MDGMQRTGAQTGWSGVPRKRDGAVTRLRAISHALDRAMSESPESSEAWLGALRLECPMLARADAKRVLEYLDRDAPGLMLPEIAPANADRRSPPRPGAHWGGHVLVRPMGKGGMAEVWRARPARGGRAVALKMALADQMPPSLSLALVRCEREALRRLDHANIVRLADGGMPESAANEPALALRPIRGESIDVYCRRRRLSVVDRVRLTLQLLSALEHAHGRGVVHGDVKPTNVFVGRKGVLVLLDFGIAVVDGESAFTRAGYRHIRAATPRYASPEQRAGDVVGMATDVWAAGLLLTQVLHEGASVASVDSTAAYAIDPRALVMAPRRPARARRALARQTDVDSRACRMLEAIVARAMAAAPADRYPTARAFAQALRDWLRPLLPRQPATAGSYPATAGLTAAEGCPRTRDHAAPSKVSEALGNCRCRDPCDCQQWVKTDDQLALTSTNRRAGGGLASSASAGRRRSPRRASSRPRRRGSCAGSS
jgi:serine/threonine protein kinase